jgi:hypothetical protein
MIDLTLWSVAIVAGGVFALAFLSPPTFYALMSANEVGIGLVAVFLGMLVNAVVIAIFGNSLGKAIFGIQVFEIGSDRRLSFGSALKRELKVWIFGLGLGFPIVTLIAIIVQFTKVSGGKPTGYDNGSYLVRQKPVGAGRIFLGILVALLLIAGVGALNALGSMPASSTPLAWTNPDSNVRTSLSSGWQADRQSADDGSVSSLLQNTDTGEQILVGVETYQGASLPQYTDALSQSLSSGATISRWTTPAGGTNVMTATGTLTENRIPLDLYVYKIGDRFWRVISFDLTARRSGHFIDRAAQTAILQTLN